MIWNSILTMTIIDILIIGGTLVAFWSFHQNRLLLKELKLVTGVSLILMGLILFASFYFSDLVIMYLFPTIMPHAKAMEIMRSLHLNYKWVVSVFGVGFIVVGLVYLVRVLFPTVASLIKAKEKAQQDLEQECLELKHAENALRSSEEELKKLVVTDKLTGAYNRTKFDELIVVEMERARRYDSPLSMLLFDIDNFKEVNDTYGHLAGDYALKTIVDIVQSHMRKTNYLIRWGGDEFVVVPIETDLEGARILSERIREAIESFNFDTIGKITVSFGIAQFRKDDTDNSFIKRVDDALYKAKDAGSNCVKAAV